jgi:hypothetical protein
MTRKARAVILRLGDGQRHEARGSIMTFNAMASTTSDFSLIAPFPPEAACLPHIATSTAKRHSWS